MHCHVLSSGIAPEQNQNRVLSDIHEYLISIRALNSTPFFDVYLINPKSNRVAHPVSSILWETLVFLQLRHLALWLFMSVDLPFPPQCPVMELPFSVVCRDGNNNEKS